MNKASPRPNVEPLFCTWQLGQDWNAGWHAACTDEVFGIETVEPPGRCIHCGRRVKLGNLGFTS